MLLLYECMSNNNLINTHFPDYILTEWTSVQDFVTSSSKVADCNLLNTPPRLMLPYCGPKTVQNTKSALKGQCWFCPFWATVETWQCNMVDSIKEDRLSQIQRLILR